MPRNQRSAQPVQALGHFIFMSEYGQELEVKHVPGHDFLEVWVDGRYTVFKRTDKAKAEALAVWLLGWVNA
jgi:hypothetical protein